jgi:hypothetical protein
MGLSKMDDEVSTHDTDANVGGGSIGNVGGADLYNYDDTKIVAKNKKRFIIHNTYAR